MVGAFGGEGLGELRCVRAAFCAFEAVAREVAETDAGGAVEEGVGAAG